MKTHKEELTFSIGKGTHITEVITRMPFSALKKGTEVTVEYSMEGDRRKTLLEKWVKRIHKLLSLPIQGLTQLGAKHHPKLQPGHKKIFNLLFPLSIKNRLLQRQIIPPRKVALVS